jgi:hypothetical protein
MAAMNCFRRSLLGTVDLQKAAQVNGGVQRIASDQQRIADLQIKWEKPNKHRMSNNSSQLME